MADLDFLSLVGPELAAALTQRGFTGLTTVQEAVLDPAVDGRDLRVTSQTGSGKTVALGLALRHLVVGETASKGGAARPRAMVVAPTRELAHQVEQELSWLYAPLGVKVVTTTGGSSARDERRALGTGPAVIVGTPGRLLDHLSRKSIDASQVAAVVLDEADRMLDLGFREDLTAILGYPPKEHRTHLVSATFPHAVRALADSVQNDPAHVEGTRLGAANADIVHRIVLVDVREKVGAVINILLAKPEEQALVFVRTRADVASLSKELAAARFAVGSLSGEMDQVARNRAMSAFKKGTLRVLVATDVAARGIDVQDIAHVIHADAPTDADTYTHRSGRTGRAGRKGMSSVLVPPAGLRHATYLLGRAGVAFRVEPVPSADDIRAAVDERTVAELLADEAEGASPIAPRVVAIAERLAAAPEVTRTLARLLQRVRGAEASEPLDLRRIEPPTDGGRSRPNERPRGGDRDVPRVSRDGAPRDLPRPYRDDAARAPRPARADDGRAWASFRVTWGADKGADARRLLAIVCRRGGIRGSDVGAIRVGSHSSTVDVAAEVSGSFAIAAAVPDPREPNVRILSNSAPASQAAPPPPSASDPRGESRGDSRLDDAIRALPVPARSRPSVADAAPPDTGTPAAAPAPAPAPRPRPPPFVRREPPTTPRASADGRPAPHAPGPRGKGAGYGKPAPSARPYPPARPAAGQGGDAPRRDAYKPRPRTPDAGPAPRADGPHKPTGYKGKREEVAPPRGGRMPPKRPKR